MLAPAQNAAEAAALEQTTGNYAYGNVSWANSTSNMRQADQWTTAPSYMGGAPSVGWRQDNGAMINGFGNGQEVFDTSSAISRLGFTPTMTTGSVAEWREMASEAHRQAQAYEGSVANSDAVANVGPCLGKVGCDGRFQRAAFYRRSHPMGGPLVLPVRYQLP